MFTEMMSASGGGTLNETTATAGSKITWTKTTPSDTDVMNYVLSGSFYVNSTVNAGDVILTVSNPPKQDTPCNIYMLPNYTTTRVCTLKTNGELVLNSGETYIAAGYSWTVGKLTQGQLEYKV